MSKLYHVDENHMSIGTSFLYDRELCNKCRGMLVTLLGLKDGWVFSEKGLRELYRKPDGTYTEGRESIHNALSKLEKLGYLVRQRCRTSGGLLGGIDYFISSLRNEESVNPKSGLAEGRAAYAGQPNDGFSVIGDEAPIYGFPVTGGNDLVTGFPALVKPAQVNPTQYRQGEKNIQ